MKKFLIALSLLLTGFYLASAINLDLFSGDKLDISNWQKINTITNKINLSSNNLGISGKLVGSGKICAGSNCLSDCGKVYMDNIFTGGTISTDGYYVEYSRQDKPEYAFDGEIYTDDGSNSASVHDHCWGTLMHTPTGRLQYNLPSPTIMRSYRLWSSTTPISYPHTLDEWQILGSNDGTNWDVLDYQLKVTDWGAGAEDNLYEINNNTAYLYYRLNILGTVADGIYAAFVSEWKGYSDFSIQC